MERDDIIAVEAAGLAAWPALETQACDGWLLRASGGRSQRANAANPLQPAGRFAPLLAEAERFYAARQRPPLFRLTPLAQPDADAHLAAAGYAAVSPSLVMTGPIVAGSPADDAAVSLAASPDATWRDGAARANQLSAEETAARDAIVDAIRAERIFVTLRGSAPDSAPLGYGLAVRERDWVGLFCIATEPEARRQGVGARVVAALMAWGHRQGARSAYLQVSAGNAPARRLYATLGFVEAYPYHYRTRVTPP